MKPRPLLLTMLALLTLHITPVAAAWKGSESTQDGVRTVRNPAEPMSSRVTIKADRQWSLGGYNDAEEELFGQVDQLLIADNGDIYLLDSILNEIRVFGANGEYLRSIGRDGEGPGEFNGAFTMFLLPDNEICTVQSMPLRLSRLKRDGSGLADLPQPTSDGAGRAIYQEVRSLGDKIVYGYTRPELENGGIVVKRGLIVATPAGEVIKVIKETSEEQEPGKPVIIAQMEEEANFYTNWALGENGRLYVAPLHDEYAIHVFDLNGNERQIITREYDSIPRNRAERRELAERWRTMNEKYGIEMPNLNPSSFRRDVERITPRPDGGIWVRSSIGQADESEEVFPLLEVFDAQGRFRREIRIDVPFNPEFDDYIIRGDKLFVLKEALSASDQVKNMNGPEANTMMIRIGGDDSNEDEDEREPEPFEIICYQLPAGV
ncbi:MAG: 6-bladed beta-propeller [bacterium]|nr:6-bladed beta-propeller [bacterium]